MKKAYINPKTDIIQVELQQMIAASLGSLGASGGDVQVGGELGPGVEGESRRGYDDFWDDEEEY